jgi:hypothetical protein
MRSQRMGSTLRPRPLSSRWESNPHRPLIERLHESIVLREGIHSRGREFCHLDLLFPKQALFYLSYTPMKFRWSESNTRLSVQSRRPWPLDDTGIVPEARLERATHGFRDHCAGHCATRECIVPLFGVEPNPPAFQASARPNESLRGVMRDLAIPPLCSLCNCQRSEGAALVCGSPGN